MRVAQVGGTWATKRGGELQFVETDVALASLGVVVGVKAITLVIATLRPVGVGPAPTSDLIPRNSGVDYAGVGAGIVKGCDVVVVVMTPNGVDNDILDADRHRLLLRLAKGWLNNLEPNSHEGPALLGVLE